MWVFFVFFGGGPSSSVIFCCICHLLNWPLGYSTRLKNPLMTSYLVSGEVVARWLRCLRGISASHELIYVKGRESNSFCASFETIDKGRVGGRNCDTCIIMERETGRQPAGVSSGISGDRHRAGGRSGGMCIRTCTTCLYSINN